jgi:hypothetical protein
MAAHKIMYFTLNEKLTRSKLSFEDASRLYTFRGAATWLASILGSCDH